MTGSGRSAAWILLLCLAILLLRVAAVGELSSPPLSSLDAIGAWADIRGPIATALALVRLVGEAAAWYLLVLSLLHLAASVVPGRGTPWLAEALALPGARRLVQSALGVGLVVAPASSDADPTAAPTAPVVAPRPGDGAASMRPLDKHVPGVAHMTPVTDAASHGSGPDLATPTTWRVEHGESFWSIAEEVLEETWGRRPSDHEVDPFWRALVDTNRHRLVTDDPDLVLPGQVFEIPTVPRRG